MSYSDNQLKLLAQSDPTELARILNNPNTSIRALTFGAELLGEEITDETITVPILKKLLKHVNAIVREGAMIGISAFYNRTLPSEEILDRLKIMSNNDPSPSLREMARELLSSFED
jgi:hypothetical protein